MRASFISNGIDRSNDFSGPSNEMDGRYTPDRRTRTPGALMHFRVRPTCSLVCLGLTEFFVSDKASGAASRVRSIWSSLSGSLRSTFVSSPASSLFSSQLIRHRMRTTRGSMRQLCSVAADLSAVDQGCGWGSPPLFSAGFEPTRASHSAPHF